MRKHKFEHTENLIKGHNGIMYEVLPRGSLFKYRLLENYFFDTGITPRKAVESGFIKLMTTGRVHIKAGFSWDGATCFPDIQSVIRSSLEHDALYTLFILDLLNQRHRKTVNGRFFAVCVADGMYRFLAKQVYWVLRLLGDNHVRKAIKKNESTTVNTDGKVL